MGPRGSQPRSAGLGAACLAAVPAAGRPASLAVGGPGRPRCRGGAQFPQFRLELSGRKKPSGGAGPRLSLGGWGWDRPGASGASVSLWLLQSIDSWAGWVGPQATVWASSLPPFTRSRLYQVLSPVSPFHLAAPLGPPLQLSPHPSVLHPHP